MKTIKKQDRHLRVTDERAAKLVSKKDWEYCAKWKALKPGKRRDKKQGFQYNAQEHQQGQ